MCTATYLKDKSGKIIFTTNRDEHVARPTQAPSIHMIKGQKLLFPRDELAGGTWIAVNEKGWIACMMNGAEGEHQWLGTSAEKSRGQVLLDSFEFNAAEAFLTNGIFEKAHPFTLLLVRPDETNIHAIKWNGSKKWSETYDANQPHIWSAYTLYPEEQRKERFERFNKWSKDQSNLQKESTFKLHHSSKSKGGLLLENSGKVDTISITQLTLDQSKCTMRYFEIETQKDKVVELDLVH